jgi:2-methylcitrate dehydratase PrpD
MEVTQALAAFAAGLRFDDLPDRVREHCKLMLLDALACALAGHQGEETHQVEALAAALAQSQEASVIGGDRLSLAGATLFNGYLITAVTMCDVHRPTLTHITPEVIPPALLIAERDGLSGRDLIAAIAAGSEVMTRIGIGLDPAVFRAKGWHGPGVLGPFGAAAAVGRLLHFDSDTMARAFGLAGSQAAGTFAAWGTPTVKFHQCRGALSGLLAALLAQQGFVATKEFLTAADGGLYKSYADGGKPALATADLGQRFELEQIALRLWPSASLLQGMNTALFDLIGQEAPAPERVRKLLVSLSKPAFDMHGGLAHYNGKFEALISAHYTAAAILYDGALTLAQFESSRYNEPALRRAAAEQVEVRLDPALKGVEAKVEIENADGSRMSAHCVHPRGSFENPLARNEVEDKLRAYAKGLLADASVEEVIGMIATLEDLPSVRALMDLLRATPRRVARLSVCGEA